MNNEYILKCDRICAENSITLSGCKGCPNYANKKISCSEIMNLARKIKRGVK